MQSFNNNIRMRVGEGYERSARCVYIDWANNDSAWPTENRGWREKWTRAPVGTGEKKKDFFLGFKGQARVLCVRRTLICYTLQKAPWQQPKLSSVACVIWLMDDHSHTLNLNTLCCFAYIPVDIDLEKVTGGASMIDDELWFRLYPNLTTIVGIWPIQKMYK